MALGSNEGSVSFGGLASGLDSKAIVEAMVQAARTPIKKIEQRHQVLEIHQEHYDRILQLASALDASAHALGTTTRAVPHEAHSSDESTIAAVAGLGAAAGRVRIDVQQLASGYLGTSNGIAPSTQLKAGKIAWHQGERAFEIQVDEGMTLRSLAQAFNNQRDGLRATVLFDGSAERIRLNSVRTGADEHVTFDTDETPLGLKDRSHVIHQAQSAKLLLDGKTEVERSSNTIGDLIAGLTLSLRKVGGPVEVDVTPDRQGMSERIHGFIERYNELAVAIGEVTHTVDKGHDPSKLTGNSTLRNLQRGMQDALVKPIGQSNQFFRSLESIGLSSSREGLLRLDESKLRAALQNRCDEVARLFGRDYIHDTHGAAELIEAHLRDYISGTNGFIAYKKQAIEDERGRMTRRQAQLEHSVERYEVGLKTKFTDLEARMSKLKSQNSFMAAQIEADKNARK